jgi:hypothetical protein
MSVYILLCLAILPIPRLSTANYPSNMSIHYSNVVHIVADRLQTSIPQFRAEAKSCAHSEYCVRNQSRPFCQCWRWHTLGLFLRTSLFDTRRRHKICLRFNLFRSNYQPLPLWCPAQTADLRSLRSKKTGKRCRSIDEGSSCYASLYP